MEEIRLSESLPLIRAQLISQETLLEYQLKLESMIEMMLAKDLIEYPKTKLHDYLGVIGDLLDKSRELNENLIGVLVKIISLNSHI